MASPASGRRLRVVIVGAGIGGLTAAIALRQRGFEVAIYERAPTLGEVGAGLQIGPNSYKVLRALGLEQQLLDTAFMPATMVSLKWDDASLRYRHPLNPQATADWGAPYMTAHRADLHRMLAEALPDDVIHLGATCVGAETSSKSAVARFADGRVAEGDVVIAADGVRSTIRAQLFGADKPRFTEMMCWRMMIPVEAVPRRLGPGGSVTLGREEYFGFLGPNGHVICYPIGDGSMLNIFSGYVTENWVEESWSLASTREELIAAYAGWNEALIGMFGRVTHVFKWGIHDRDPIPVWTKGRISLLGDAAHPTMPTLAQGGNMAIEDGYILARALEAHGTDVERGLAAYVAVRQPRTARITLQSRAQFMNNRKVPPPPNIDRNWIYIHDVTREAI